MSDAVERGDAVVALPPSKRRRRESFEEDPPLPATSADIESVPAADHEAAGESKGAYPNEKSSDTKDECGGIAGDSGQNLFEPDGHGSSEAAVLPLSAAEDNNVLPPMERNLQESRESEADNHVDRHPDGNEREFTRNGDPVDDHRRQGVEGTGGHTASHQSSAPPADVVAAEASGNRSSEYVSEGKDVGHGHRDDPAPSSAYSPQQENGTGRPYGDYDVVDGKRDAPVGDRNGASDDYDRDREYTPLDRSDAPPPNVQGPQQQHGNSVLAPEVANVLNGLFERGFFEDRDIDGRAIDFLASVTPELALSALEDIQHRDFSTVRNKPAFIFSIFKRVVAAGGAAPPSLAPPGGFPPATVPASALAHLPPQVSDALQRVFASGVCHPSQFDDRAMDILVELHPLDAVRALSEFAAMEPGRVRNPSAFWMGLARKFKNSAANGPNVRAGPGGFPGGGPMGPGMNSGPGGGAGRYSPNGAMDTGVGFGRQPPMGFSALDQRLEELMNMGVLRPDSLDDRAADALRKLPEQDALSVLAELPDPSRVRNMSAYVMGLCKKFATGEARSLAGVRGPPGGYGGHGVSPGPGVGGGGGGYGGDNRELHDALNHMDPDVRGRFYAMVDRGMFPEQAFDHRAIGALQSLNVREACAALDELAASDPRRIHNISAYFMGLARKFGRM